MSKRIRVSFAWDPSLRWLLSVVMPLELRDCWLQGRSCLGCAPPHSCRCGSGTYTWKLECTIWDSGVYLYILGNLQEEVDDKLQESVCCTPAGYLSWWCDLDENVQKNAASGWRLKCFWDILPYNVTFFCSMLWLWMLCLVNFKRRRNFWVLEHLLMLHFPTCRDEIFAYYMMLLAH